ncbi:MULTISPECIES: GNAT family N-acetyltransferase [unclassified Rhizobium]|jgi:GNAT superfamily N-acetyltransferase|uniref:GNAT family N-acetyltransferase n=1 Tax=unclassified Rhizobium TaxID=2613769 RepID=UPI0006489135|nr:MULTISPECIES: GNAT family N-acetyltransferase [unclassified Rhizobium]OJY78599.1 MAG: GNAT family N-acetyltransferase [Rhizobium sp. 60-20]RKD35875.1 ribosomal protein S18 acetylase RimI-like enzyme [Rhizobium sp. WW_1]
MTRPTSPTLVIRPWMETDSINEMTVLLHRAYGGLARMGLRFMATHQKDEITAKRIAEGQCFVGIIDGRICGTILFKNASQTRGCAWYDKPEVSSIAQFGVEPDLQAKGLGRQLIAFAEKQAIASGARELSLDTAEPATHLVDWYTRLGYRFIGHEQWSHTNYRSIMLSKTLLASP